MLLFNTSVTECVVVRNLYTPCNKNKNKNGNKANTTVNISLSEALYKQFHFRVKSYNDNLFTQHAVVYRR